MAPKKTTSQAALLDRLSTHTKTNPKVCLDVMLGIQAFIVAELGTSASVNIPHLATFKRFEKPSKPSRVMNIFGKTKRVPESKSSFRMTAKPCVRLQQRINL